LEEEPGPTVWFIVLFCIKIFKLTCNCFQQKLIPRCWNSGETSLAQSWRCSPLCTWSLEGEVSILINPFHLSSSKMLFLQLEANWSRLSWAGFFDSCLGLIGPKWHFWIQTLILSPSHIFFFIFFIALTSFSPFLLCQLCLYFMTIFLRPLLPFLIYLLAFFIFGFFFTLFTCCLASNYTCFIGIDQDFD